MRYLLIGLVVLAGLGMVSCAAVAGLLGVNPETGAPIAGSPIDTLVGIAGGTGIPWLAWLAPALGLARWGYSEVAKIRTAAREKRYFDAARATVGALEGAFLKADANGDGKIDAEELKGLLYDKQVQTGTHSTILELLKLVKLTK